MAHCVNQDNDEIILSSLGISRVISHDVNMTLNHSSIGSRFAVKTEDSEASSG